MATGYEIKRGFPDQAEEEGGDTETGIKAEHFQGKWLGAATLAHSVLTSG